MYKKYTLNFFQASISGDGGCPHIESEIEENSSDDEMYDEEYEDEEDIDETKERLAWADKDV